MVFPAPVLIQTIAHVRKSRSLIQGGLNAAKDLKGRKLGESIVTNTANSRQLFHVGKLSLYPHHSIMRLQLHIKLLTLSTTCF